MQPGDRVERYVLRRRLGEGASGEVWLAVHEGLGTEHALKLLKHDASLVRKRATAEARAQARLRHPNVVAVTDVLELDRQLVLVQEYVEGPALDSVIADFALSQAQIDAVAVGVLAGLGCAHAAGLVHRDVKPANVLLAVTPDGVIPKIADFGLVRDISGTGSQTRTEATLGTPAYMAPEQFRDARRVDQRSDLYSVGAMLYELVSGLLPYHEEGLIQLYEAAMEGRFRPLDALAPSAPRRWIQTIHASLSPDPEKRPANTTAMLAAWVEGMPQWPEPVWEEPVRRRLLELAGPGPQGTGTVAEPVVVPQPRPKRRRRAAGGPSLSRLGLGVAGAAMLATAVAIVLLSLIGLGVWWSRQPAPDGIAIVGRPAPEPVPVAAPAPSPVPVAAPAPAAVPAPVARPTGPKPAPAAPSPAPVPQPVVAIVPVPAPAPEAAPAPPVANVSVQGDVRVVLGAPSGALIPAGDVAPGLYSVWAYFDADHPTRVLDLALEGGQHRVVRCNLSLRTCR